MLSLPYVNGFVLHNIQKLYYGPLQTYLSESVIGKMIEVLKIFQFKFSII